MEYLPVLPNADVKGTFIRFSLELLVLTKHCNTLTLQYHMPFVCGCSADWLNVN